FGFEGSISYQRTLEPAPPAIVCCVQIANLSSWFGSIAPTACVKRASRVSRVAPVPACGAAGGTAYLSTEMLVEVFWIFALPLFESLVTLKSASFVPGVGVGRATTQPLPLVSISFAGTGEKAGVDELVIRFILVSSFGEPGHPEPDGGLWTASTSAPAKTL